jgi:uncharacterized membrane protein YebE (DUF533 family)
LDQLKELAGGMLGGESKGLDLGALAGLAAAVLGGKDKGGTAAPGITESGKGQSGQGALAMLGMLALNALRNAGTVKKDQRLDPRTALDAGLRAPQSEEEREEVQSVADLTLRAMVNAAKADGRVDEDELRSIAGRMKDLAPAEREHLLQELRQPMDTDDIVRAVRGKQVAAQIYAASVLATNADTPAEKKYLADLARKLDGGGACLPQIPSDALARWGLCRRGPFSTPRPPAAPGAARPAHTAGPPASSCPRPADAPR